MAAGLLSLAALAPVMAQTAPPARQAASAPAWAAGVVPQIEGKTIEGNVFRLESLKGRVVLVMFWSTGCAVCLDKMHELRTNYEGWSRKPFSLVAINTDTDMQDFISYERIISATVPVKQRFAQLWNGDAAYKDNLGKHPQLPAAFLVDKSGKIIERYIGRIPPEAWDQIADLL